MRDQSVDVGERIRSLREKRGISLRSLARTSGLSANTLSMIERGLTSPSVGTLYKLADSLGLPVTSFFTSNTEQPVPVIFVKSSARRRVPFVKGKWEGLGGEKFVGRVEPFVLTLEPGADSGSESLVHTGHEFVYCLNGRLEYEVEEQVFSLAPGDSLLFAAHLRHRWRNRTGVTTTVLLVLSGFSEGDYSLSAHYQKSS